MINIENDYTLQMISDKQPIVSVVIITYNSAEFVAEALESAKDQSYKKIELIISDDASTDNTVRICKEWLVKNKDRFVSAKLLTVKKNTGISANFKRGFQNSSAEWIKFCAGDDALLPNCIEDNINYVLDYPDIKILYSYNKVYKNEFKEKNFLRLNPGNSPLNIISDKITAFEQYQILLIGNKISFTPSIFLNKKALLDAGLPDEDLFSEDYQTVLKLTKKGYKLNFMEKVTVLYRQHDGAINSINKEYIIKPHYFKTEDFRKRYRYPFMPLDLYLSHKYCWIVNQIFRINLFNKKNEFNKFLHYLLNVLLNPFKYIIYIKSNYIKKYKNNVFYQI